MPTELTLEQIKKDRIPKCSHQLVRKPEMFYWRGRFFHGMVCEECNALYDDAEDSFFEHVLDQHNKGYPIK